MIDKEDEIRPEQSLKLITSMIESAKYSIGDQSHFYLLWGWAVMIGCLLQYFLKAVMHYQHHYNAWLVTPLALIVHFYFVMKQGKRVQVSTFIGEANKYLWTAIGIAFFVLTFIFIKIGWQYCYPVYILFYGIGTYVSGSLLKFRPFIIGGLICMAIAAFTAYLPYDYQILATAIAILVSYIIPGHMLRLHYRKNKTL